MRNPVLINVQVAARPTEAEDEAEEKSETKTIKEKASSTAYTPTSLTNYYLISKLDEKISRLVAFLKSHRQEKIIGKIDSIRFGFSLVE